MQSWATSSLLFAQRHYTGDGAPSPGEKLEPAGVSFELAVLITHQPQRFQTGSRSRRLFSPTPLLPLHYCAIFRSPVFYRSPNNGIVQWLPCIICLSCCSLVQLMLRGDYRVRLKERHSFLLFFLHRTFNPLTVIFWTIHDPKGSPLPPRFMLTFVSRIVAFSINSRSSTPIIGILDSRFRALRDGRKQKKKRVFLSTGIRTHEPSSTGTSVSSRGRSGVPGASIRSRGRPLPLQCSVFGASSFQ